MTDVMIDLETLGTEPGSVILSIGAVYFRRGWGLGPELHLHLQAQPQLDKGAKMAADTVLWWLGQLPAAQRAIVEGQSKAQHPVAALGQLAAWLDACGAERVWGNGADFDLPLLVDAFRRHGHTVPWRYNAGRCCRTVLDLAGKKMNEFGVENPLAHDALSDARYQARVMLKAMEAIRAD